MDSLEKLHNQAMRLIIGAVKSTPNDLLFLNTNSNLFSLLIRKSPCYYGRKLLEHLV